jgi:hypothetical protein
MSTLAPEMGTGIWWQGERKLKFSQIASRDLPVRVLPVVHQRVYRSRVYLVPCRFGRAGALIF